MIHLQLAEDRLDERVTFWPVGVGVVCVVAGVLGTALLSSSSLLSARDEPLNWVADLSLLGSTSEGSAVKLTGVTSTVSPKFALLCLADFLEGREESFVCFAGCDSG